MKKYLKKLLAASIWVSIMMLFAMSTLGAIGNHWYALGLIPCLMVAAGIQEIIDFTFKLTDDK